MSKHPTRILAAVLLVVAMSVHAYLLASKSEHFAGLAIGPEGSIYVGVADRSFGRGNELRIQKYTPTGKRVWVGRLTTPSPPGILVKHTMQTILPDDRGNVYQTAWILNSGNSVVVKYDPEGSVVWSTILKKFSAATLTSFGGLLGVVGTPAGPNEGLSLIVLGSDGGVLSSTPFPSEVSRAEVSGLCGQGELLLKDPGKGRLIKFNPFDGNLSSAPAVANNSSGAVSGAGEIYQWGGRRVSKMNESGQFVWERRLSGLVNVATDDEDAGILVAELGPPHTLSRMDANGNLLWQEMLTIAPEELAVDEGGNAYIACSRGREIVLLKYDSRGNLEWRRPRSRVPPLFLWSGLSLLIVVLWRFVGRVGAKSRQ